MHKGKSYPFNPTFWVIQCQFWPGFLPWKFNLAGGYFLGPGEDALGDPPYPLISGDGYCPDVHTAIYEWPVTWSPFSDLLQLKIVDSMHFGQRYVDWRFAISLAGEEIQVIYAAEPTPRYSAANIDRYWYSDPIETDPFPKGSFNFYPATYAQGGSPWSS